VPDVFEAFRYADVQRLVLRTQPRSSLQFMVPMREDRIVEISMMRSFLE
jgi:hypothetical protein